MAEADSFDPGVLARLKLLQDKYASMGQDLTSYLDGLLHADFPTYWDYIKLDTLLKLSEEDAQEIIDDFDKKATVPDSARAVVKQYLDLCNSVAQKMWPDVRRGQCAVLT